MSLLVLLKPKFLSVRNSMTGGVFVRRLPFLLIGALFWVFFYIASYKVLSYIRGMDFIGEIISKKLLHMIFFSLGGFLLLSNIITSISSFYLSRDMPFLISHRVEIKDIIRLKTSETVAASSWMVVSFLPPVFLAYGVSYEAGASYYIVSVAALLFLIFISAGMGITVSHILTRLFPARGIRDFLLLVGLVALVSVYFIVKVSAPEDPGSPLDLINRMMSVKVESPLLPSYWASEASAPMKKADFFYLSIMAVNAVFILLVSETVGLRLFRKNLEGLQTKGGQGKSDAKAYYPGCGKAMIYKDTKVFFRDRGQWSQLLIIGALALIYYFNFRSIPVNAISGLTPFFRELMVLINLVMAGLVLVAVAARFLYSAVSFEGQAFWIIKSSPTGTKRFLMLKFLSGCIPVTALISALVFVTNLAMGVSGALMYASLAVIIVLCLSVGGLGAGLGAISPNFRYENIASVSMSIGGMSFMFLAFTLVLFTLALAAWPFYLMEKAGSMGNLGTHDALWAAASIVVLVLLNFLSFYIPLKLGIERLHNMEY